MVIKNLTNKQVSFSVKEITGDNKVSDHFIIPYGSTEIERVTLVNPNQYVDILEVDGTPITFDDTISKLIPTIQFIEKEKQVEVIPEVEESQEVEITPEPAVADTFKCDICGAEFASARGLSSHKNKAHSNE